ncbi:MAG TPA: aminomethyl-transferring glycine dehydrogenase subunit GcvPA [Candidatus Thalassarchaeaceae archaeon]|jgi:glycine dehydrogenase subunit 1|nr:aminomethyl-transferring glycine dehydrogenase [Euryarchaeota archaeon]DAC43674.1 MAG TPA: aminomethyl-transferring glycine dehydrogenase subunit GcvPA [Candidatus Poseidoniales archaeon]HII34952.1 aminomethyl-transferring glycine dehydrogenase subunit GcvPA [Candidatus Thalassarchaeaceae archaeon]
MDQLPNLGREQEMLDIIGVSSMEDLFEDIPVAIRSEGPLPLPPPQSEEEILRDAEKLLGANVNLDSRPSFISAGLARNFVPSMVPMIATRGEFLTSYTPYQPEVSQGMLQAMWEFQTMISELVGLPISNVSMYDASTSAAEAITCAVRVKSKKVEMPNTVYVSELVPPHRMSVIENYTQGVGIEIRKIPHNEDGFLDLKAAADASGSCAIYVEQPNAFGILDEGLLRLRDTVGEKTAIIVGVDVTSLGVVEPPGNWGADIVVGEGQPFGIGPTGGGPIYGIFACKKDFLRLMPGRIVGQSIDTSGKTAYTLTLSTREQHIRRHRATSNICSNETLIALMGAMHMALLGPVGLETLSTRILSSTRMAIDELSSLKGLEFAFPKSPVFREFAVKVPGKSSEALSHIFERGVIGGFDIGQWWPEKDSWILIGCDERTSESDISSLKNSLSSWVEASS